MYVPSSFAMSPDQTEQLLQSGGGDLVTATSQGLLSTFLPLLHDPAAGALLGHVARNNDQWRIPPIGEAMVILRGPDAYVSPGFYATKAEHGRVVPTWNYVTAHVYGDLVVHDAPEWVEDVVRRLTALHESREAEPWSVDDAPEAYFRGQLRAIVGIELRISRIEAKAKLSQNRPAADVDGVIAGLAARGDEASAAAVRAARQR